MGVSIDRERSAARIDHDVQTPAGPAYTSSTEAIRRYAYRPEYRAILDYFTRAWEELGFTVTEDPIGNLVARNRPPGEPVFGIGSHCDSNRNGGKWDGTLGVVSALEAFVAIDDGRPFWDHAQAAGYEPTRWRDCAHILDDLTGWIELHIEQGRVLQDTERRIGVVKAIAGYVHGDIRIEGRADHAGATPMDMRCDSAVVAAETILE